MYIKVLNKEKIDKIRGCDFCESSPPMKSTKSIGNLLMLFYFIYKGY